MISSVSKTGRTGAYCLHGMPTTLILFLIMARKISGKPLPKIAFLILSLKVYKGRMTHIEKTHDLD